MRTRRSGLSVAPPIRFYIARGFLALFGETAQLVSELGGMRGEGAEFLSLFQKECHKVSHALESTVRTAMRVPIFLRLVSGLSLSLEFPDPQNQLLSGRLGSRARRQFPTLLCHSPEELTGHSPTPSRSDQQTSRAGTAFPCRGTVTDKQSANLAARRFLMFHHAQHVGQ